MSNVKASGLGVTETLCFKTWQASGTFSATAVCVSLPWLSLAFCFSISLSFLLVLPFVLPPLVFAPLTAAATAAMVSHKAATACFCWCYHYHGCRCSRSCMSGGFSLPVAFAAQCASFPSALPLPPRQLLCCLHRSECWLEPCGRSPVSAALTLHCLLFLLLANR